LSVLSEIRRLPDVIQNLTAAVMRVVAKLDLLISLQEEQGTSEERLEELEVGRARWEAEMEAMLLKSDSTLKSASNAESRSRTMLRHAEKLSDTLDLEGEDVEETVSPVHAPRGEEEGLQPVHLDVALSPKEIALRHKFA